MKRLLYIFSLFALFSCNQDQFALEDNNTIESEPKLVEMDGVVYPSTNMDVKTRTSYNGRDIGWVNASKVTLPNGQKVDFPWVDGGSLPFFMQQKLRPENGWELIAYTMAPDTQNDRSYLLFHNYITGTLRVFCYMSTFATNNNGYWKISFSEPTKLLNFTGEYALPMNQTGKSEITVSNNTTQDSKGFALGWNCFQLELAYDPKASGIMKIEPMNINTTSIEMTGGYTSTTEGNIVGTSTSTTAVSNIINGIGHIAGNAAEIWVKSKLPYIKIPDLFGKGLLSLAKSGVTSAFSSFSGLFDKTTQEIKDVNLTTKGNINVSGTANTQTAAPIAPVNIHLNMIDGYLGSWNLEEKPYLRWYITVFNDCEANINVTNREYFYQVPAIESVSYQLMSNSKAQLNWSSARHRFIRQTDLPNYANEGDMELGSNAIGSPWDQTIYEDGKSKIEELSPPNLRVRIRIIEYPTSEKLPGLLNLPELNKQYVILEREERKPMDIYLQITCHTDFVINGVVNEYFGMKRFQCKHDWGGEY